MPGHIAGRPKEPRGAGARFDARDLSNAHYHMGAPLALSWSSVPAVPHQLSGELAYEINMPSDHGHAVWEGLLDAGAEFDSAHGIDALIFRVEKGQVTG
jgi:sarcosine oxidase subunit alpha